MVLPFFLGASSPQKNINFGFHIKRRLVIFPRDPFPTFLGFLLEAIGLVNVRSRRIDLFHLIKSSISAGVLGSSHLWDVPNNFH